MILKLYRNYKQINIHVEHFLHTFTRLYYDTIGNALSLITIRTHGTIFTPSFGDLSICFIH